MAPETIITCVSPMEIRLPVPEYVLGFLFLHNRKSVVLIRKNKPEFQAGKLNGVGGRIEPGESAHDAMIREFSEETGKLVSEWSQFATMEFSDAAVHCFSAQGDERGIRFGADSPTAEQVEGFFVDQLPYYSRLLSNLRWLIPMALSEEGCPTIRFD